MGERAGKTSKASVWTVAGDPGGPPGAMAARKHSDIVSGEEPLEIRLIAGGAQQSAAVTMRTPGADFELAAGFLFSEGIVAERSAIEAISYCADPELDGAQQYNIVNVRLRGGMPDLARLERHFAVTSACGVCGKASLDALRVRCPAPLPPGPALPAALVPALPERLRAAQRQFAATGGLHAAALFDASGALLALREDVGRHNALDKLIGWALLNGRLPLSDLVVFVSGRTSYELAQKCVAAGAPVLAAISAPSSLAVQVAQAFNLTLIGFVREGRFNVYAGMERIAV